MKIKYLIFEWNIDAGISDNGIEQKILLLLIKNIFMRRFLWINEQVCVNVSRLPINVFKGNIEHVYEF